MNTFQTNYQALENDEVEAQTDSVIVHVASEGSKSRWNHIPDLDSFFRKVYEFHQKHGFLCIVAEEVVMFLLFLCVIFFGFYMMNCIHFNFDGPNSPLVNKTDVQLPDLFMSFSECSSEFGWSSWTLFVLLLLIVFVRVYLLAHQVSSYKEIEQFYETALRIPKTELHNYTWHEVQCKLGEVQHEQQMCVNMSDLTELDIYHRILRKTNYMVALVNKNILPLKQHFKFIGEWVYFPTALDYNIQILLFGALSPFKDVEYKKYSKRNEVAAQLTRGIRILALINLTFFPIILIVQLFMYFLTHSGLLKYEPHYFSSRKWSSYSRLYLRHFNELDHELNARLGRAHEPSKEYMKSFSNPFAAIVAKFFKQVGGCIVVFFFVWGIMKEKIYIMEHVILIIAVGTLAYYALSALIPDEDAVYYPSQMMQKIVAELHYVPDHFKTMAHTSAVRDEFSHLFEYRMVYLLEELISSFATPIFLLFYLQPRALDIVDFFRCFTVEVTGVGDVCSFALMDVSKHGNQNWVGPGHTKADQIQQAEDGKTELSLIHFKMMNPHWIPPDPSAKFIEEFKEQVNNARLASEQANAYYNSLNSISTMGSKYASLVNSIHQSNHPHDLHASITTISHFNKEHAHMNGGLSNAEGPPYLVEDCALPSLTENEMDIKSIQDLKPMEIRNADMSLNVLFLHGVHDKFVSSTRVQTSQPQIHPGGTNGNEEAPLLDIRRSNYVN